MSNTFPQGLSETEAKMPSPAEANYSALEGIYIEFFGQVSLHTYVSNDVLEFFAFFTDDTHQTIVPNVLDVFINQTVEILKANCNHTRSAPENTLLPLVNQCPFNFQSKD
jgi:hypothetical protein